MVAPPGASASSDWGPPAQLALVCIGVMGALGAVAYTVASGATYGSIPGARGVGAGASPAPRARRGRGFMGAPTGRGWARGPMGRVGWGGRAPGLASR